jgi:hypothetical protein
MLSHKARPRGDGPEFTSKHGSRLWVYGSFNPYVVTDTFEDIGRHGGMKPWIRRMVARGEDATNAKETLLLLEDIIETWREERQSILGHGAGCSSCLRMHAARCPGSTSSSGGTPSAHAEMT